MKLYQALTLLLIPTLAGTEKRELKKGKNDEKHELKKGKNDGGSGGSNPSSTTTTQNKGRADGTGAVYYGVDEPLGPNGGGSCIPFGSSEVAGAIANSGEGHSVTCNTNQCGSSGSPGCCQFHYNLLMCDENNLYSHQPCVCNNFTAPRVTGSTGVVPVSTPVVPATTPAVVPVATPVVPAITPAVVPVVTPVVPATTPGIGAVDSTQTQDRAGTGAVYYGVDEAPGPKGGGPCIPFGSSEVAGAIATSGERHSASCNTNQCGSSGSPGCCQFHYNLLMCDENNLYSHQPCVCNDFTAPRLTGSTVPVATPAASPHAVPATATPGVGGVDSTTTTGQRADGSMGGMVDIGGGFMVSPKDTCQVFNEKNTMLYQGPNPFSDAALNNPMLKLCTDNSQDPDSGCPRSATQNRCCLKHFCFCSTFGNEANDCVPAP